MIRKVFLSHNSADKPEVEALALRLHRERGIEPWLDKWNLIPGQPWQEEIEEAMEACDCCAIFIGRGDPEHGVLGPWQNAEMRALISRQVTERGARFGVIPVLLPGAERGQRGRLPPFLTANTWVEFRNGLDDPEAYGRLLAGIRRERPGPPAHAGDHPTMPASPPPPRITTARKQKILFLAANSTDETRRSLDHECREIEERIRAADHRDSLEMLVKGAVRSGDLLQYLQQHNPHIVHFSGHGGQSGELFFLDAANNPKPVTTAALRHVFGTLKDNIRVVVLNACFSRPQAQAITEVIDCAVGMDDKIGDGAAILFAAAFYQAIGFGKSVRTAFDLGISALMLEGIPGEHVPVLLTRTGVDPARVFLIPPNTPEVQISNIPASIGSLFKGREEFLERLRRGFQEGSGARAAAITATRAVHGLGGIGKTRAAIEYAHRHREEYSALLLVRADTADALETNLANLTSPRVLDLPEHMAPDEEVRLTSVLRWLEARPGWLLIADNADTEAAAAAVESLLGGLRSGHVLITSRLDAWSAKVRAFDLETLTEGDAVSFLLERTGSRRPQKASDAEDAPALAARLDGLALALEQAAAYIAERRISFARYLEIFDERRTEMLAWHDARLMDYPVSVAVTWLASFEQLGTAARRLLDSLAFMAPDPIPRSLIENSGESPALEEALVGLSRYSLVRFLDEPQGTFSIHRLVQEIVRSRLDGTAREVWEGAVDLLLHEAPANTQDVSTWNAWRRLAPHCAAVLAGRELQESSLSVLRLMEGYAGFLHFAKGDHAGAEPLHRRALAAHERVLGPEHPFTLNSLNNLAGLLHAKGDYAGAEPLHRRALAAHERVLGPEHPFTLNSLNNLAGLLHAKGDYAGAEPLHRRALTARERVLGPEHPDTLVSLNSLAELLRAKGDHAGAEPLHRKALAARERVLGPEHPFTLNSLNNLAGLLQAKGDHAGAEPLHRRALEARERVLGPEHPDTLVSLNSLAELLHAKGNHAGAEPLHRRALEARERVLGPEHPFTLNSLNNLAGLLQAKGDHAGAEPLHRRALEARERVLGPEHPFTLNSLNNLAGLLQAKGDHAGAEPLHRRALEARERVLGPEHPFTLNSLNNLAALLHAKGDHDAAEPLYRKALEARERVLGPEHPDTLNSLNSLAALLKSKDTSSTNQKRRTGLISRFLHSLRSVFPPTQ